MTATSSPAVHRRRDAPVFDARTRRVGRHGADAKALTAKRLTPQRTKGMIAIRYH